MFSPAIADGGPARNTRSNRRRQRPLNSDSVNEQPKAKRQRVPLAEATFVNPDAGPEMYEVKPDKVERPPVKRDGIGSENPAPAARRELSVRPRKAKAGERVSKGDGSVVLTTNNAYTVSKLPALPDRVRADTQGRQHGAVYASSGHALSVSHTHAFVWPYTSTTPSPETFVFALPYPSKHVSDPLPLASLVSPSAASDDPGLVVVMPVSGKIAYWESISSAATLDFIRQQRTGVEDAVHGMYSGEHVSQMVNAESAGFVLVFSTGRLAYMNVRDGHGRPAIFVRFLRGGLGNTGSGFFGGLRHALSAPSLRGDMAAVHANHDSKVGERVVVAATSRGRLFAYRVHRGGHHDVLAEVDVRDEVVASHHEGERDIPSRRAVSQESSFEILDFAFVPRGLERKYRDVSRFSDALSSSQDSLQHLLLLVSLGGNPNTHQYSLVEVVLSPGAFSVGMIRPLTSFLSPIRAGAPERPRLYLPRPALVAFAVFDRAVVVASLASPPDSPDSQLQEDSHIIPATFEDVVDLRDDETLQVVGSGAEEPADSAAAAAILEESAARGHRHHHKTKNPAAVVLVRGVGAVRVGVADIDRFASERPPRVTAKSKLEQAVFFGIKADNPLVFEGRRALPFSSREIGQAAVQLSHEIINSRTPYVSNLLPVSLESHMQTRSGYLDKLIDHLGALGVDLDQDTRRTLLYDAEKMAVAACVWRQHESFLAERPRGDKKSIVSESAARIKDEQKAEDPTAAPGDADPVRHLFLNDVWRLDLFIAWGYQVIKYHYQERMSDAAGINRLIYEAVTVCIAALHEAHRYRAEHSVRYGLRDVVADEPTPEPWDATHFITNNFKRLIEFCYQWLDEYYPNHSLTDSVDPELLESIRLQLPALTDTYLGALADYATWAARSDEDRVRGWGKVCRDGYDADSRDKVAKLKEYGLWDQAIGLAEKNERYDVMAQVVVEQIRALREHAAGRSLPAAEAQEQLELAAAKEERMGDYFDRYGSKFAFVAYSALLAARGIQAVLDFPYDRQGYATLFLRDKPELAKISWINDVEREHDLDHAAETLLDLGLARELQVWNKKIELSLGKLALMAEEEEEEQQEEGRAKRQQSNREAKHGASLERVDRELSVIRVQDALYAQIRPSIHTAIDAAAEVELAVKAHGGLLPEGHKVLADVFHDAMARLVRHEVLSPWTLIDLLTLVHLNPDHIHDIGGDQFFLALQVAQLGLADRDRDWAERLIWRRCYVRDDWKLISETSGKADLDQLEAVGETATYRAMFGCIAEQINDAGFAPFVRPSVALGVFTDQVPDRFAVMDDNWQARYLEAVRWEDAQLRHYVDKCQLDQWFETTLDTARKVVQQSYDEQVGPTAADSPRENGTDNKNGTGA